jgi:hypothetical protein
MQPRALTPPTKQGLAGGCGVAKAVLLGRRGWGEIVGRAAKVEKVCIDVQKPWWKPTSRSTLSRQSGGQSAGCLEPQREAGAAPNSCGFIRVIWVVFKDQCMQRASKKRCGVG